jgi:glyoxylase-like metal-dependent hydrolase (beta-lactamase superfamily II)
MVTTLTFLGAAGTVTGSKFLLEHEGRKTLVDCGLYQGERTWRRLNWQPLPVSANLISDVVLTHAHLDHCGHLPALVREGFTGPTWCTQVLPPWQQSSCATAPTCRKRTPRMPGSGGSPGTTRHARCTTLPMQRRQLPHSER